MATTSQAYTTNSSAPTSALASASSAPASGPSDTISSPFSSSGSVPLIVAFLAIGLFAIVVIGVFGWRRFVRSRELHEQSVMPIRRRQLIRVGKRPILWDVQADPKVLEKSPATSVTRWENITPMTAILTLLVPSVQRPHAESGPSLPIRSMEPNGRVYFPVLRSTLSAIRRFYFPDPPPPPPPPPLLPEEKRVYSLVSRALDKSEWGGASYVRVSVIITLPTPQRCRSEDDTDPEGIELGEFCIGTVDVPLSRDG